MTIVQTKFSLISSKPELIKNRLQIVRQYFSQWIFNRL